MRISIAFVLGFMSIPVVARGADPPNVVLIVIDDLGQRDLGCYGSTYHRTPHLDRLAREGTRFTDAYAACPVCSPTRAAILTGKYPARLHLTDWLPGRPDRPDQRLLRPVIRQQLPLEEVTLAEALGAAGYATAHVGKWHLGGEGFGPREQGFDINIAGDHTGTPLSYFAPFQNKQGRFMPGLEQAPEGEYLTDRLTAEALRFIDQNRTRPFFLYLAHYAVHIPLRAKPDLAARYPRDDKRIGVQNNPIYAAMIESVDEGVGRLMQRLADAGLDQKTLVIFTSDNGGLSVLEGPNTPATINAPYREGKGFLYEGGVRVPLLVRGPGVPTGALATTPVSSIDLFPTILDLCNLRVTSQPDGLSLVPLFRHETLAPRPLFWHYPHYANQGGRPGGAVRDRNLKLIEFDEGPRRELFDLNQDPGETRNLIDRLPEEAQALAARLEAWRQSVAAQRTRPNPGYAPNPQAKDGSILLHARAADVHGIQLRYEALPHKNTLGFWTRVDDYASWEFQVVKPGRFRVEVLQGCGKGQGGSEVEVAVAGQTLVFQVEDTGHFQNFQSRSVGLVTLDRPGSYTLRVSPRTRAAAAVMDLRSVALHPAAGP